MKITINPIDDKIILEQPIAYDIFLFILIIKKDKNVYFL